MIDKLRSMAIFASVVEQGSFRSAARHLSLSPSRVSQNLSDLENELGVTLLYRTTRQLALTSEGRILYSKVTAMLEAAESGLDAISPASEERSGELRVTAPAFILQTNLMDEISGFTKSYPRVNIEFNFTDSVADLIGEGYDVSIRAGWLEDSDLMSRTIGHINRLLVASPEYCESKPVPKHPNDLEDWLWIRFKSRPDRTEMSAADGQTASVIGKSHIKVDAASALYEFATRGTGLTELPERLACRGIENGELVQVLPDWSLRNIGIHAVWPDNSRRASLALMFVRYLAEKAN